jgi:hypothetical protein
MPNWAIKSCQNGIRYSYDKKLEVRETNQRNEIWRSTEKEKIEEGIIKEN